MIVTIDAIKYFHTASAIIIYAVPAYHHNRFLRNSG